MESLREDYALILEGSARVELDLARTLLEEAGIPCLLDAHGFELDAQDAIGVASVPYGNLYVPRAARAAAHALLEAAWGPGG